MHSDVYGTVPAASETDTKMNKANEKQDEAAFVTVYGAIREAVARLHQMPASGIATAHPW